jgi:crotonobetainyl-CoA:carnitine CoA-transferase CaiB-like acyl-CoA transferase
MKLVVDVEHPKAGVQRQLAAAIRMTDTPARIDRPSPLLGQHTEEVLLEFGWDRSEVDDLVASGVAQVGPRD